MASVCKWQLVFVGGRSCAKGNAGNSLSSRSQSGGSGADVPRIFSGKFFFGALVRESGWAALNDG